MPKGKGYGRVVYNNKTEDKAMSADELVNMGNSGNTYGTKLPHGGKPRGAKKMG